MVKEELQYLTIHELRIIGRKLGVKHPTMLRKKELINEIINCDKGLIVDKPISRRGRKAHAGKSAILKQVKTDCKIIDEVEKILNNAKNEIISLLIDL